MRKNEKTGNICNVLAQNGTKFGQIPSDSDKKVKGELCHLIIFIYLCTKLQKCILERMVMTELELCCQH